MQCQPHVHHGACRYGVQCKLKPPPIWRCVLSARIVSHARCKAAQAQTPLTFSKISIRPSRSMVARICSEPGEMAKGTCKDKGGREAESFAGRVSWPGLQQGWAARQRSPLTCDWHAAAQQTSKLAGSG